MCTNDKRCAVWTMGSLAEMLGCQLQSRDRAVDETFPASKVPFIQYDMDLLLIDIKLGQSEDGLWEPELTIRVAHPLTAISSARVWTWVEAVIDTDRHSALLRCTAVCEHCPGWSDAELAEALSDEKEHEGAEDLNAVLRAAFGGGRARRRRMSVPPDEA